MSQEDGITQYFRPSEVNGPDQLFCEDCKVKTDSTVKLELKQHPEVLMLLLKRFKFNYSNMHYYKVQRRVELPLILEIQVRSTICYVHYFVLCVDHLNLCMFCFQNQTYELYAFVEHRGYLKSGHYTANIKSHEDGKWYHFNDDRANHYYQFFQLDTKETSRSAYLLFYRKISADEALNEESNKECTPESSETLRGETNEPKECNEKTVDSQRSHEKPQSCDSEERQETEESLEKKIISVEKEEELKDQMMKSLRKEEEKFKEQMRMRLMKEEEDLKDQMMKSLRREEENFRDRVKMNLKKEEKNFREQMMMNLKKEVEELKKEMMVNLRKEEENFRDQMRMNLKKEEEELKKEMMVNLWKEEENLKDQMRMRAEKQKEEENIPEHQTKASKHLTFYDLYKNPLQSSGDESRVRSSERSQELEGENRRRSTQHEQQSENKSTENNIYTGNSTGRSIQSNRNMETVEVQRGDFRAEHVHSSNVSALVKDFESLSNEACGQSRDDPSNMNVEHDEGSRKNSCIQQRDTDTGNKQRTNDQLPQTGGTTLTNDGCDDGSDSVHRSGGSHRSAISVRFKNQSPGKKNDSIPRSNVEKREDSENSCDQEDHQSEHSNEILQQDATYGSNMQRQCYDASQHYNFQQCSTEMTPEHRAPSTCDSVNHLTKSLMTMTLRDRQTDLTNEIVKTESSDQQMLSNTHGCGYHLVSPNYLHLSQTYPNSQSHAACFNPSYSQHNIPEYTESWSQQIMYNTQCWYDINPVSPVPVSSCPIYQNSPGNTAFLCPSYSRHNMPAEYVTAPTDTLVISTPFGPSMEPMNHISAHHEPAGSQSGSGIGTRTQFRSESLTRETRAELSHDCRGRDSAGSQVQVITIDPADPRAIGGVCGCFYPKTHKL
uniref:ubiquitinyl hydrolase 1 n=1 Tax=Oryzias melastigma TaxID=30732 RepID=A0A3B3C6B1_ORYME